MAKEDENGKPDKLRTYLEEMVERIQPVTDVERQRIVTIFTDIDNPDERLYRLIEFTSKIRQEICIVTGVEFPTVLPLADGSFIERTIVRLLYPFERETLMRLFQGYYQNGRDLENFLLWMNKMKKWRSDIERLTAISDSADIPSLTIRICSFLKTMNRNLKISQSRLAKLFDTAQPTISNIIRGRNMSKGIMKGIIHGLKNNPDFLKELLTHPDPVFQADLEFILSLTSENLLMES